MGRSARLIFGLALLVPAVALAQATVTDFDAYKLRIVGFWFDAKPSGSIEAAGHNGGFDFQKDVGFNSYSTFSGVLDWKFTRKNHIYFEVTPFDRTKQFVTSRTIIFRGQTFNPGVTTSGELAVFAYAPGYQYDLIRRKRGHLGLAAQVIFFDSTGSLNAAAQISSNGVRQAAASASASLLAPIPCVGPDVRFYLLPNSTRLFVTGRVLGMGLAGYGNFVSTTDTLGLTITRHLSVRAGYQLASRLNVNTTSSRTGISLTQKGAVVGLEASFGH